MLKASSAQDTVQEFQKSLRQINEEFHQALAATVYVNVMTTTEKAEGIEISNWLTFLDFVGRLQDIIRRHTPDTRTWFLERDDIQDWMYDREELRKLWFTGYCKFL